MKLLILTAFIFASSLLWAQARLESQKPRHYIFTVHGLNGTEKTFGALDSLLENHMGKVQSQIETRVFAVTYPTTNEKMTTYDFSHSISLKITEAFHERPLQSNDRISFVTHSQGGLVTWIWYLRSLSADKGYEDFQKYAKNVDAIVTLGSPLWGSRLATLAAQDSLINKVGLMKKLFGQNEIKELAHGSNTIQRFRYRAAEIDSKTYLHFRPLAIAGVMPKTDDGSLFRDDETLKIPNRLYTLLELAERFLASGHRLETDIAVDLPSARSNFLYAVGSANRNVKFEDFKALRQENTNDLIVVNAPHMSWVQDQFFDIAEVPQKCINVQKCSHPTYPYILSHLLNCDQNQCEDQAWTELVLPLMTTENLNKHTSRDLLPENLSSFILDVEVELPEGLDRKKLLKEARLHFPNQNKNGVIDFRRYQVTAGSDREFLSKFKQITPAIDASKVTSIGGKDFLRLTYYGRIESDDKSIGRLYAGYKLPFYIFAPGLPQTYVEAKIRTTFSTFVSIRR